MPTRSIPTMFPLNTSQVDVIAERYNNIIKSKEDKREVGEICFSLTFSILGFSNKFAGITVFRKKIYQK